MIFPSDTGYINRSPGWAPCPGVAGPFKTDSMYFCTCAFVLLYFVLLISLLVLIFIPFFKEHDEKILYEKI